MTHHELCLKAGEWLQRKNKGFNCPTCKYVLIEVNAVGCGCIADVFGFGDGIGCGFAGVQIECKMSHSDFLRDKKKQNNSDASMDIGYMKYYCCPEGIIEKEELKDDFGLLYLVGDNIEIIKDAKYRTDKQPSREVPVIASLLRRIKVKPGIFDFKK